MSGGEQLIIKGVVLSHAERVLRKSPWPTLNRATSLQWTVTSLAFGPVFVFMSAATDPPLTVIVFAALLWCLGILAVLWAARRVWVIYGKLFLWSPTSGEADNWRIDSDTVATESISISSTVKWNAFVDVVETPEVFHFLLNPAQIWALPKRAMNAGEIERLQAYIDAARVRGDLKGVPL